MNPRTASLKVIRTYSTKTKEQTTDERTAALLVYILWAWLEQHPESDTKMNYPLFSPLGYFDLTDLCPWCEIYYCFRCPLGSCTDFTSQFRVWRQSTRRPAIRSKAAGNIAAIAWREYKRLEDQ